MSGFTTPEKSDKKEEHPKTTVAGSLHKKLTSSASSRSRSGGSDISGSDIDIDKI